MLHMSITSCPFNFTIPPRLSQLTDISREEFLASRVHEDTHRREITLYEIPFICAFFK